VLSLESNGAAGGGAFVVGAAEDVVMGLRVGEVRNRATVGIRRLEIRRAVCAGLLAATLGLTMIGCASSNYVSMRRVPRNPLAGPLQLLSPHGPQSTPRTKQLVRRFDLDSGDAGVVLAGLQREITADPQPEKLYASAELAYIDGRRAEAMGRRAEALDRYGEAVAHAYWYLLDPRFDRFRNPYDPQFRGACDLYNGALEAAMRIVNREGQLRPGETLTIETPLQRYQVTVTCCGNWNPEDFERFEFVSDYEIKGLSTAHHTYGLGVPLIVVRRRHGVEEPAEGFYPPGLSFAATAFLRVLPDHPSEASLPHTVQCVLELHDPLATKDIQVAGRRVPLETDLTTPLAYFLDNPAFEESRTIATLALLMPDLAKPLEGLYMLEPYDPRKIPVLMVHGLWSSPLTWMEMFNELRSFPEVREQYQFWFYLYPTGQPFWISAAQLRRDLQETREILDPDRQAPALDQMVLVGHSMGGLVSRLQTFDSGDDYWHILSDQPFEQLQADDEARQRLAQAVFFDPNPSVRRVITIGTPHRGSEFANDYTRWLGRALITLPEMMVRVSQTLVRENPGYFKNTELLTINTSIDSLAPDSPVLPVMLQSPHPPWTRYHNIVGLVPDDGLVGRLAASGDGVVSYASAHLDDVESEVTVPADHVNVHRHPRAILEVRRILLEHRDAALAEIQQHSAIPVGYDR
jgi:pimeloyl-ACP methyl ester carboxylesterase